MRDRLRPRNLVAGAIACFLWARPAAAELQLDKLTACSQIDGLVQRLNSAATPSAMPCRGAETRLEKILAVRYGPYFEPLCFLREAPSRFLDGFNCLYTHTDTGSAFICFREIRAVELDDFKANFEGKYAASEKVYLDKAATCSISRGDTDHAAWSSFPPQLALIAEFDLGWISAVMRQGKVVGSVVHGYGREDPAIAGSSGLALEFFTAGVVK